HSHPRLAVKRPLWKRCCRCHCQNHKFSSRGFPILCTQQVHVCVPVIQVDYSDETCAIHDQHKITETHVERLRLRIIGPGRAASAFAVSSASCRIVRINIRINTSMPMTPSAAAASFVTCSSSCPR